MASEIQAMRQNLSWKQNKRKANIKTSALPTRRGKSIQEIHTVSLTLPCVSSKLIGTCFRNIDIKSGTDLSGLAIVSQRLSVIRHVFRHKLLALVE